MKELRFIDPTSFTTIVTSINFIIGIIIAIIVAILLGITNINLLGAMIYIIPTIIFGTLILSIINCFLESSLYNALVKKMKCIKIDINEDGEITKIDPISTSLLITIINVIVILIYYLATLFFVPLIGSALMNTLMMGGDFTNAMMIYQVITLYVTPMYVLAGIVAIFIISLVATLLEFYLYNFIASKYKGATVKLNKSQGISTLESIDVKSTAIIFTIIGTIFSLIEGIIIGIATKNYISIVTTTITGFIVSIILISIMALLYNILSEKICKLQIELL